MVFSYYFSLEQCNYINQALVWNRVCVFAVSSQIGTGSQNETCSGLEQGQGSFAHPVIMAQCQE